ncbi:hypothetical protein HYT59_02815 [Candidatus Woesebacteria bacterium]|nr:hypothetical protein [Candidatus Woesebacteria bacterium]
MKIRNGQSLFELVVAIGVVALILYALVALATLSVRNASFARNESEAARLGQEAVEWLRLERDKGWDQFIQNVTVVAVGTTRCVEDTSWSEVSIGDCTPSNRISSLFEREVVFGTDDTNNDAFADRVTAEISVSWTDGQGYHEIKNSTYFTDWRVQ